MTNTEVVFFYSQVKDFVSTNSPTYHKKPTFSGTCLSVCLTALQLVHIMYIIII